MELHYGQELLYMEYDMDRQPNPYRKVKFTGIPAINPDTEEPTCATEYQTDGAFIHIGSLTLYGSDSPLIMDKFTQNVKLKITPIPRGVRVSTFDDYATNGTADYLLP